MDISIRTRLVAITTTAALTFVILMAVTASLGQRVEEQLTRIQTRFIPRLELAPKLEADFAQLTRTFQDAAIAKDRDTLAGTRTLRETFMQHLKEGSSAVDPADAAALRAAFDDYYGAARPVTEQLIAGEGGEALNDAVAAMQDKQRRVVLAISQTATVDRNALSTSFGAAAAAQGLAVRVQIVVSLACLALLIGFSVWLGRGIVRSLTELRAGFERFGAGNFTQPIAASAHDELGEVAERANTMAQRLNALAEERQGMDWVRSGVAGLTQELRGDLTPPELAGKVVMFMAHYLQAPAAALYFADSPNSLVLLAHHGVHQPQQRFRFGQDLIGEAVLQRELLVLDHLPAGFLRVRSSLGEAEVRAVMLAPLARGVQPSGVLELAFFAPLSPQARELVSTCSESIAIALEVARARQRTKELLEESQQQAQRLAAQEEELRASNEELELKADELAQISGYKSQFLANMSHELRTPLNAMLLLSHQLAENSEGNLSERQIEHARTINGAGKDLLALINQVLDLARIESGKQQLRHDPVDIGELAERARRMFEPLALDKHLDFAVEVDPTLPATIVSDQQRLEQIITNLLGNAIKFTSKGAVRLRVRRAYQSEQFKRVDLRSEHCVAFEVSDTGTGIAPEHHERIFAAFEQVDGRTDRRFGGSGLGLNIARELAALLGGEIHLESELGRGSTFTCYVRAELPATTPVRDDRPWVIAGGEHILLVEDDRAFAEAFGEVIHNQGFKYLIATSAEAALRSVKEKRPLGIILDVKLPDKDGFSVMEKLRADPNTASIPVHIVSAVDASLRGLSLGAIGYVGKPASPEDLTKVVNTLVSKHKELREPAVLVVEPEPLRELEALLSGEKLRIERVTSGQEALAAIDTTRFACAIVSLGVDTDGVALLRAIEQEDRAPPIVLYTTRPLTKEEAKEIENYAEAIVLKEGRSSERLLNEVRLFVRRLRVDSKPAPAVLPRVDLSGRRILVVDDDMRTVYALSAVLRAKGAEVLVADTGVAALKLLDEAEGVELVLMDIMMPEMDGYEATRRVRQQTRFKDLPIIALTAKAMVGDEERCRAAGASDYLPKPIDAERLAGLLAKHLGNAA